MATRKKRKVFRASKAVKAAAREHIGQPPATRAVPARNSKPPKRKPTLGEMLAEE
ncbi:MAG: hypothetical protein JO041_08425 [Acidobacteria bacterium]|nr:hypothetical protein [Acidobacteriota bacterium]